MAINPDSHKRLIDIFGTVGVLTDPADCWPYGTDNSIRHACPDVVVFPTAHAQIVNLLLLCNQWRWPVTTRGRGTGTTGACVPIHGGVVVAMENMNKILNIEPNTQTARVHPGIINGALQRAAGEVGLFWPPDPSSMEYCTVGGNLACNAGGPRTLKYGATRENTLWLKAVTGDGREFECGTQTSKGAVGFDLTRLLIGSEGTLAIITEAVLKLTPKSDCMRTIRADYRCNTDAINAVMVVLHQTIRPCALEFIDNAALDLIRVYGNVEISDQVQAMLIAEVDGSAHSIDGDTQIILHALSTQQCIQTSVAVNETQVQELWATRKALSPALRKVAPNKINEDIVVPIPRVLELIEKLAELSKQYSLPIINFGHIGNGNVHVNILYDANIPTQAQNANLCLEKVFNLTLALGGTLSGEHGIGLIKRDYVKKELSDTALDLMKKIKNNFDPNDILNPGKSLPE